MSLKSFHIIFAVVTTGLFIFMTGFYGHLFLNTQEYKYAIISGVNLILTVNGIYYCNKTKILTNL